MSQLPSSHPLSPSCESSDVKWGCTGIGTSFFGGAGIESIVKLCLESLSNYGDPTTAFSQVTEPAWIESPCNITSNGWELSSHSPRLKFESFRMITSGVTQLLHRVLA